MFRWKYIVCCAISFQLSSQSNGSSFHKTHLLISSTAKHSCYFHTVHQPFIEVPTSVFTMPHNTSDCTSISIQCPVDLTIYGYYPNLGANAFFCAYFGLFTIANVILGLQYRKWVFASFVTLGCLGETIGYIGRIIMHGNPWSSAGFETQICTLIFSPVRSRSGFYFLG